MRLFQRPATALVRGSVSILAGFVIWEILARLLLENELLIPPPSSVFRALWKLASSGALNEHFLTTFLEFANSMRLTPWQTTYKIRLPATLPYIITGMRLGVGRALLGVVAAELLAANAGLGYLLRDSAKTWDSPKLFLTVILLAVIGLL